jgi:hypothetical protein
VVRKRRNPEKEFMAGTINFETAAAGLRSCGNQIESESLESSTEILDSAVSLTSQLVRIPLSSHNVVVAPGPSATGLALQNRSGILVTVGALVLLPAPAC